MTNFGGVDTDAKRRVEEPSQDENGEDSLKSRIERAFRVADLVDLLERLKGKDGDYSSDELRKLKEGIASCDHPNTKKNVFRESVEQKWGYVFHDLKEGDVIAAMLFPSADFLSIKKLNAIFGESVADMIRDKGFELMTEFSENEECGFKILQLDFGKEIIKAKKGVSDADFKKQLEQMSVEFSTRMTEFINENVRALMVSANPMKTEEMSKFLADLNGENNTLGGFHKTYGITTVGEQKGTKDYSNVLEAVSESVQMAQYARQFSSDQDGRDFKHGTIYDEGEIARMVGQIQIDLDHLVAKYNNSLLLHDEQVNIFEDFPKPGDQERGVSGRVRINSDVLYAFRKGEIEGQEELVRDLGRYLKTVNLVDLIRPYTYEEIAGESLINGKTVVDLVEEQVGSVDFVDELLGAEDDSHALGIMNAKFKDNINTLLSILTRDSKDVECTSRSEFYSRMKGKKGFVVSMDFVKVGVDQLMAYEQVIQDLEGFNFTEESNMPKLTMEQIKELKIKTLSVSDQITERLRKARGMCRAKFGENVLMAVGGDEIMIFVESEDREKNEDKDEVLKKVLEYQKSCQNNDEVFRLRASVVRKTGDYSGDLVDTIFKSERGIDFSKGVEKRVRISNGEPEPFCVFVNGQDEAYALVENRVVVFSQ